MSALAFAGLGSMGQAMVRRLLDQGHQVTVWNRSPAAGDELVARGARRASHDRGGVHRRPGAVDARQ